VPQDEAMTSRLTDDPTLPPADAGPELADRFVRLEGEVAELRQTLAELAEIVVGDIKERREAALAVSAPVVPEMPVPESLVPGGQNTVNATPTARRPWLLVDFFKEIGTTIRMYMDARYRVRRGTQLMVPLLFGLMAANYLFFNLLQLPILTPVLERLILILLAVLLYKVLSREVARYRQMLVQYGLSPRAWRAVPVSLWSNEPDTAAVTRQESP
jgi:hypothetical protein